MVAAGAPGATLTERVISPSLFLSAPDRYRVDSEYYISKRLIPALDRLLSLMGADLHAWYVDMPKPYMRRFRPMGPAGAGVGVGAGEKKPVRPALPTRLSLHQFARGGGGGGGGRGGGGAAAAAASVSNDAMEVIVIDVDDDYDLGEGAAGPAPPQQSPQSAPAPSASISASRVAAAVPPGSVTFPGGKKRAPAPQRQPHRTIDSYFASLDCELCGNRVAAAPSSSSSSATAAGGVCDACAADPQRTYFLMTHRAAAAEAALAAMLQHCRACTRLVDTGPGGAGACESLDCPVFFERGKLAVRVERTGAALEAAGACFDQ